MKRFLLPVLVGFALLLLSSTEGWSFPCLGDWNKLTWTLGCVGKLTEEGGNKYVGEFRGGNYHGQGTLTYADGDKYVGEFRGGNYHGQGTYTFADGSKYVGEWKDHKQHGQGTYTFADGVKYVGEFRGGNYHGQGTFTYANGDKYVGEYRDDKQHGQGTYTFGPKSKSAGDKYVGEFKDDKFHGQGIRYNADGSKYVGEWKDDKPNGQGTFTYANGDKYVGEYRDDKQHGQGTYTFADGSKYVGEIKDDKPNGQGTFTYANGSKYVGEFRGGNYNGQGTYTFGPKSEWPGDKYVGEYRNDKKHGQGTYTSADGENYVGEYKDDIFHGQGTYTSADGDKYVGGFKNGLYHGQGTLTYADGRVKEGIWENDEFKYANKLSPEEPTVTATATQTPPPKPVIETTNKRIALVVGNSKYNIRPLDNPVRDARLIGTTLKQYGFRVTLVEDADYRKFRKAIARFGEELRSAGPEATAFFYYSGHGMQYQGNNYLIPIGSEVNSTVDLDLEFVRAERVQSAMAGIYKGVKIMLLDACRNSPFKSFVRSEGSGLAQMDAPKGTIIGYATAPGKVARDGMGRNSPYALGLVRAIKMPGLTIEAVLKQTLNWVDDTTNGKQVPWYSSSLRGDFYFSKK